MPDALNPQVVDDVTSSNFKAVAGRLAERANAQGDIDLASARQQLSFQASLNAILTAVTTRAVETILTKQGAETLDTVASGQQAAKIAQSTPPETARPTSGTAEAAAG